jgi:hypothetical protein
VKKYTDLNIWFTSPEEITGGRKKLPNKEHQNLSSLPKIVGAAKLFLCMP